MGIARGTVRDARVRSLFGCTVCTGKADTGGNKNRSGQRQNAAQNSHSKYRWQRRFKTLRLEANRKAPDPQAFFKSHSGMRGCALSRSFCPVVTFADSRMRSWSSAWPTLGCVKAPLRLGSLRCKGDCCGRAGASVARRKALRCDRVTLSSDCDDRGREPRTIPKPLCPVQPDADEIRHRALRRRRRIWSWGRGCSRRGSRGWRCSWCGRRTWPRRRCGCRRWCYTKASSIRACDVRVS
jgi:hypothetical protein